MFKVEDLGVVLEQGLGNLARLVGGILKHTLADGGIGIEGGDVGLHGVGAAGSSKI